MIGALLALTIVGIPTLYILYNVYVETDWPLLKRQLWP